MEPDAVERSLNALRDWLAAQQETNARYRDLQAANQQLTPAQTARYAAEAAKVRELYYRGAAR